MSLSVDTEAETQDFTSGEEQFMLPECLTPSKLSAWLMGDSKSECLWNVCVIHKSNFHRHLILFSQALNQQPSISLTLIQYLTTQKPTN